MESGTAWAASSEWLLGVREVTGAGVGGVPEEPGAELVAVVPSERLSGGSKAIWSAGPPARMTTDTVPFLIIGAMSKLKLVPLWSSLPRTCRWLQS
jgi:hypothetical protein